jgi:hypothetical protein
MKWYRHWIKKVCANFYGSSFGWTRFFHPVAKLVTPNPDQLISIGVSGTSAEGNVSRTYSKLVAQGDSNMPEGEDGVLAHQTVVLGLVLCIQPEAINKQLQQISDQWRYTQTCTLIFHCELHFVLSHRPRSVCSQTNRPDWVKFAP